jgi:hypothetical protein
MKTTTLLTPSKKFSIKEKRHTTWNGKPKDMQLKE